MGKGDVRLGEIGGVVWSANGGEVRILTRLCVFTDAGVAGLGGAA